MNPIAKLLYALGRLFSGSAKQQNARIREAAKQPPKRWNQ